MRPGDRVWARITILDGRRSTSKPDRGVVHNQGELLNQDGVLLMRLRAANFYLCREPG